MLQVKEEFDQEDQEQMGEIQKDPEQMLQIKGERDQKGQEQVKLENYFVIKDSYKIQTNLVPQRKINSKLQLKSPVTNFEQEEIEIFNAIKIKPEETILNEYSDIINQSTISVKRDIDVKDHEIESGIQPNHRDPVIPLTSFDVTFCSTRRQKKDENLCLNSKYSKKCIKCRHEKCGNTCTFTTHIRLHTSDNSYSCNICSLSFSRKSSLTTHMRIHTIDGPYSCNKCSKIFSQKSHLRTHMRIHSGDRPYSCNICSKTFSQNSHLTTHMRVHSSHRPYSSNICSRTHS